jgi:hypothetical protein
MIAITHETKIILQYFVFVKPIESNIRGDEEFWGRIVS